MSGIYLHIPFCKQACNYCNFHFATSLRYKDDLIAAMLKEIALTPYFEGEFSSKITSVYFGGGTPSILSETDLKKIFAALQEKFLIEYNAEITLEANPDDISTATLTQWKEIGINRLSVGIQSFEPDELVWMNRVHTTADAIKCIDEIKQAGFNNFSIDLIYGSPLLNNDNWKRNVELAIKNNIPHISSYALTVEPKTPLDKLIAQQKKAPVSSDKQAEQFVLLMDWMQSAGYEHYEISNFALPGLRSKHNSSYWQGKQYYAFGPSAHSFDGKKRRWNVANNAAYINALKNNQIPFEEEMLTNIQQLNEYIMTAIRTIEGIDLNAIQQQFGEKFAAQLIKSAAQWLSTEKLFKEKDSLKLTMQGKLFADGIAADLFFE